MTRIVLAVLALAACEQHRSVQVQIGPNSRTITQGFRCVDAANTPLLERAIPSGSDTVHLTIVVDLIDLGGRFPGCRGEEIVASCNNSGQPCRILDDGVRYCREDIQFTRAEIDPDNLGPLFDKIRDQLGSPVVTADAPSQPVLIRAVATAEPCATALDADGFDPAKLVGCAYSCPVQLDAVDGPIALSIDAFDSHCEGQVLACAAFR